MKKAARGYALQAEEGDALWFLGHLMTLKATGAETRGQFTLIESQAPPGFAPPLHVHHREDEAFYLLDGEMQVTCGDQTWSIGRGGFAFLPRGVPHGFRIGDSGPVTMLQLTLPAQFERFAAAVGLPAGQRTLPPPTAVESPSSRCRQRTTLLNCYRIPEREWLRYSGTCGQHARGTQRGCSRR